VIHDSNPTFQYDSIAFRYKSWRYIGKVVNCVNYHVSFHNSYRNSWFISWFTIQKWFMIQDFKVLNANNENQTQLSCTQFLLRAKFIYSLHLFDSKLQPVERGRMSRNGSREESEWEKKMVQSDREERNLKSCAYIDDEPK
jgi:hypothetical protein